MNIKTFTFNPFQVNTYIFYTSEGQGLVVDPGMSDPIEQSAFQDFVSKQGIHLVGVVNTHGHVDHVVGNDFVRTAYGIPLYAHRLTWKFLQHAAEHGAMYGFNLNSQLPPDHYLDEGDIIPLGKESLEIYHTPGHADGSICLYHRESKILIAGDVLFNGSIGRTDLPTGDMDTLLSQIKQKLMVLPPETMVYPGHGPKTSIAFEQQTNPFLT